MTTWTIEEGYDQTRIDVLLTERMNISRAQVQKMIKAGGVTVNGKPAKPHSPVFAGDVLSYPSSAPKPPKPEKAPTIPIVYEDDHVIVVDKPSGIQVHPAHEGDVRPSVIGELVKTHKGLKKIGGSALRPGIVHRLDKDVSGVMVIAKTEEMFDELKRQFSSREVEKEYVALVYDKVSKDHGEITFAIARSKTRGRMVARPDGQEAKEAHTAYDVVERFKNATLVRVKIATGRTHQIRTHFKAIGHPVVGDKLYYTKIVNIRPIDLGRLFLHARSLTFTLPDGTRKTIESELPTSLSQLLTTLPKV
jgi:23S rRNA pseudouridine1911/1915/1917 synthase